MVALLLKLRFRVLANTIRRDRLQLVAVLLGGSQAALLLLVALGALLLVSTAPPEATQAVVVVAGSALVMGWVVIPLLFDGVEQTLDPRRLAPFPIGTTTLMTAMMLVGILWIPGVATIVASLGTSLAWRAFPVAAAVALLTGLVGALTCIAGSRLTTSVVGALLRGRTAARIGIGVLALLVLAGPLAAAILGGLSGGDDPTAAFAAGVAVLGWTPLGAIWSVPGRLALGDTAGAAGAGLIGIGALVGVLLCWRIALSRSLSIRSGGTRRTLSAGSAGLLGRLPTGAVSAIAGRSLIYWFRDARLARQLVIIPVLPTLLLLWWWLIDVDAVAIAAGPVVAALLPMSMFAGLSYDGTALAAQVSAGVRGVHDRLGRAIALLVIGIPALVAVQVTVAVLIGRADELPALFGLSFGILLVSIGVVSVSSARLVVPVARSGRSPFSAPAGAAATSILASYAVMAATIVIALPILALTLGALSTRSALLGWIDLGTGLVLGVAVAVGGVMLGGRWLDASGADVLARLRLIRA